MNNIKVPKGEWGIIPIPYFIIRSDIMDIRNLDQPLNIEERYLYGINVRLNILIEMLSSFLDVYAKKNQIATTSNEVVEEVTVTLDEEDEVIEEIEYEKLTKAQITEILDAKGIEYNSRMTKAELIELLK